ncbi:MAG: redoxin domain-containing protein [Actinomycetota bacterium]|nr:redoxin domain-containing protein [Actinomycetota bacterium]
MGYIRSMRGRQRLSRFLLPVTFVLLLTGCQGASRGTAIVPEAAPSSPPESATSGTHPASPSTTISRQAGVFAFVATTVSGEQFDASQLAGRDVAMWFWAPWCENCNHEAPTVARAARQLAGEVAFVGVAGRDEVEPMRVFLALHGLEGLFPQLADVRGDLWARFGVTAQPTWIFVDDNGAMQRVYGEIGEARLHAMADRLRAT